jgi:hypothetical protein
LRGDPNKGRAETLHLIVDSGQRCELHRTIVAPVAPVEAHDDRTAEQKARQRHRSCPRVGKSELRHTLARPERPFEDAGLPQSHLGATERANDAGQGPGFDGVFECLHLCVQRHG